MADPYFNQAMTPWGTTNGAMTDPNQTQAAREIRRDLIKPYAPILSADLIESNKDYHVYVDLPGVEDLSIEVQGRTLVIKAERKVVHDKTTDMVHSVERSYGKVQRQILLPMNADLDNSCSKFENGVLRVSFPKIQAKHPNKILTINR